MKEIVLENSSSRQRYRVIKEVMEPSHYHLYLCIEEKTGRECLLQIASTVEHNGILQRAAYILRELEHQADEAEEKYKKAKTDPDAMLNYKLGFPELVDSFICPEQGGRQVNILAFRNTEHVADMVPLINITAKNKKRIDLRTSAWIMGKSLKLLDFLYSQGISINLAIGWNILIDAERHYVLFFDFTKAQTYEETVPKDIQCREIASVAYAVYVTLGGTMDLEKDDLLVTDATEEAYFVYLWQMVRGGMSDAGKAHKKFYEIVDATWERKFHPFTTKPLEETNKKEEKNEKDIMEE